MSVRKRGNRYILDFYPEGRKGKRVQRALPLGISEAEAYELAAMIQAETTAKKDGDLTISILFSQYLSWYKMHRSITSYVDVESVFRNHIHGSLGKMHPDFLTSRHLEFYQKSRLLEGGTNRTINKELGYFGGFLRWAEKNRLIKPQVQRVSPLPYKRPLPIVLLPAEANAILLALNQPYRAFCTALYTLGLRFSEAKNLVWENVDLEGRTLKVKQKGGSWKVLPINQRLMEELLSLPGLRTGLVFRSPMLNGVIKDIRKPLQQAARRAGITKHVNPHLFRHSIATSLMDKGVNLRVIQGYLGHSDIATTQFYTHVAIESLKQAENVIVSLVPENNKPKQIQGNIDSKSLRQKEQVVENIEETPDAESFDLFRY